VTIFVNCAFSKCQFIIIISSSGTNPVPRIISGAMKVGVPQTACRVVLTTAASPKSYSFRLVLPSDVRSTYRQKPLGWQTPTVCAQTSPSAFSNYGIFSDSMVWNPANKRSTFNMFWANAINKQQLQSLQIFFSESYFTHYRNIQCDRCQWHIIFVCQGHRMFAVVGCRVWNMLPALINLIHHQQWQTNEIKQ